MDTAFGNGDFLAVALRKSAASEFIMDPTGALDANGNVQMIKNPEWVSQNDSPWNRGLTGWWTGAKELAGRTTGNILNFAADTVKSPLALAGMAQTGLENVSRNRDYYWNKAMYGDAMGAKKVNYVAAPKADWRRGRTPGQGYFGTLADKLEGNFHDTRTMWDDNYDSNAAPVVDSADQAQPGRGFWIEDSKTPAQHPYNSRGVKRVEPTKPNQYGMPPDVPREAYAPGSYGWNTSTPAAQMNKTPSKPVTSGPGFKRYSAQDIRPGYRPKSLDYSLDTLPADGPLPPPKVKTSGFLKAAHSKVGSLWGKVDMDFSPGKTMDKQDGLFRRLILDPGDRFGHAQGLLPRMAEFTGMVPKMLASEVGSRLVLPAAFANADKLRGVPGSWRDRFSAYSPSSINTPEKQLPGFLRYALDRTRPGELGPYRHGGGLKNDLHNLWYSATKGFGPLIVSAQDQLKQFRNPTQ